jgi:L-ribulose-5-phosphate 3-epimerase UlaE
MHEYNTHQTDIERDNFSFAHGMDFQNTLKIEIMDTVYINRTISSMEHLNKRNGNIENPKNW